MPSLKAPRALRATTGDIGDGRYPKALLASCASWALLGVILLVARLGLPTSTDDQETDAATGVAAVRVPDVAQGPWVPYLWILGVIVIVFAVVLFLRQGWARLVLALLGMVGVVALAAIATWLAIPAAVLFVVGAVCSVLVPTHRYLTRPRSDGPPADQETTRVVS
jgi:hypothetical protein